MRGKLQRLPVHTPAPRITPARAGKTMKAVFSIASMTDHPRACGENSNLVEFHFSFSGSPPRVRGKLLYAEVLAADCRITPARAGKTCRFPPASSSYADHPRACGENLGHKLSHYSLPGSPPRVRGKPLPELALLPASRITPARAGKTRWMSAPLSIRTDHPRACGENRNCNCGRFFVFGSPPRVRGKRPHPRRARR